MAGNENAIRYQQLQQLIHDINFDNAIKLPSAVGAEGLNIPTSGRSSSSWLVNRFQDSIAKNDMTLIASSLKGITDILDYRKEISGGEKNPFYDFFNNLRKKAARGEHVSWQEFTNAINTFSADDSNNDALQDVINNTGLASENEREEIESVAEEPSNIIPFPESEKTDEEPPLPEDQPGEGSGSSGTTPLRRPLPPPPPQEKPPSPYKKTPEEQQGLKERMKKSQEPKPSDAERPKNALPERRNSPISSKTRKKAIPRTARAAPTATRLAPGASSSGGALGALNNYLGLRDLVKAGQWAAQKLGQQWLSNLLQRFFTPEKLLGQALKGLANLGAQLGRQLLSSLARGAANILSRLALQAAGKLLVGLLANPYVLLAAAIIGIVALIIWREYDANSQCGQDGTPQVVKNAINGQQDTDGETKFTIDQEIEYQILINHQLKCPGNLDVEVRDTLPENVDYVLGSSNSPTYTIQSQGGTSALLSFEGSQEGRTLVWKIKGLPNNIPFEIRFKVKPKEDNVWVINETTARFTIYRKGVSGAGPGGRIIDSQSKTFNEVVSQAAQNMSMDPTLLKAILKVEAGGVLEYSEEEFVRFSTPGWWEGADAAAIKRGYAYNTCDDPTAGCGAGNDVRGVAQFELATWKGIVSQLQFADGHEPDRRNARDAIFGSAVLNRRNAESYAGTSNLEWTEDVIRAMARMYCAGPGAGKNPELVRRRACGWDGTRGYDDFVWDYYRQFSGQI